MSLFDLKMSGHSHAKTIMATKMANDAKKGKIYSKYSRLITIAVKDGGGSGDPFKNAKLKAVIEQAKKMNMPKENIERAVKKGTGELAGDALEEVSFEGFGPGGIAIIVEGITDNKNRALGEIKTILNQNNGKLAGEGAVRWLFDKKGIILASPETKTKEEAELLAIEAGAEDVLWSENCLEIYTSPEDLEKVRKSIEDQKLNIEASSIEYVAKEKVDVSEKEKQQAENLFEALEDNDAINNVYSNLK